MTTTKETAPEVTPIHLPQPEDEIVVVHPPSFWINLWETIKDNLFNQPLHN